MSQGLIENIAVGLFFWVLDIGLIVLLLPAFLRRVEDDKWGPMRSATTNSFANFRDDFYHELIGWVEGLISDYRATNYARFIEDGINAKLQRLRDRIDILSPSLTPDMSKDVLEAFVAADELTSKCSYIFTMVTRGHGIDSARRVASDIAVAANNFDLAVNELAKRHKYTTHVMNPSFAFLKYFLNKYFEQFDKVVQQAADQTGGGPSEGPKNS